VSDWLRDAMRAWSPGNMVPAPLVQAMRQVVDVFGFPPAVVAKEIIEAATSRLVGRSITVQADGHDISLVLRQLRLVRPPIGLVVGQLGDVEMEADDVEAPDIRISHLRLDVGNVHLQPGLTTSTIVAAPIRARAVIARDEIEAAIARRSTRVEVELRDGAARAYVAGRRDWGHVDVVPRVDGRTLVLEPAGLSVRRWDRLSSVVRRLPPLRVPLPRTAADVHVTAITVEDGRLVVDGVYEEWRHAVTPVQLDQLVRRVQRFDGGVLRLW
jgi:hypothetical protein